MEGVGGCGCERFIEYSGLEEHLALGRWRVLEKVRSAGLLWSDALLQSVQVALPPPAPRG